MVVFSLYLIMSLDNCGFVLLKALMCKTRFERFCGFFGGMLIKLTSQVQNSANMIIFC